MSVESTLSVASSFLLVFYTFSERKWTKTTFEKKREKRHFFYIAGFFIRDIFYSELQCKHFSGTQDTVVVLMKRRLESRQVNGPHSSSKGKIDETVKRRVHNSSSKQIRSYIDRGAAAQCQLFFDPLSPLLFSKKSLS